MKSISAFAIGLLAVVSLVFAYWQFYLATNSSVFMNYVGVLIGVVNCYFFLGSMLTINDSNKSNE
jgi:hypothetical protein